MAENLPAFLRTILVAFEEAVQQAIDPKDKNAIAACHGHCLGFWCRSWPDNKELLEFRDKWISEEAIEQTSGMADRKTVN